MEEVCLECSQLAPLICTTRNVQHIPARSRADPAQPQAQLTEVPAQQGLGQGRVALLEQGQLVGVGQQHLPQQRRVVQALRERGRVRGRRARPLRRGRRLLLRGCPGHSDAAEIDPGQA